ncbi:MAG: Gfo/Idh/MocA family oxidoreductase [Ruminococcaceae bacterium]|nr:Gfo/Idh/MocA family oxidoreductase [Oscillospiraceae bacterium]
MKPIRIAQIGMCRYIHGPQVFEALVNHPECFDVAGYALVENERSTCAHRMKCFEGHNELSLEAILNDPSIEAVTVETDEIHLTKYAKMAVDAGKHVFMDKPGSPSFPAFERLIESVKKSGKVFQTGYMYRYNSLVSRAVEDVKNGAFGTVYCTEAHMSRYESSEKRRWLADFKGGMMFYLGCHLIDLVLQIQGIPERVIPCHTSTGIDGVESEDMTLAILQYPHGVSIIRVAAVEVGGFARRQLVICGSKRTLEIKPLEVIAPVRNTVSTFQTERSFNEQGQDKREVFTDCEAFERYGVMLQAFAKYVRGEAENPYTPDYELELFRLILRCCGADPENEEEK